MYGDVFSKNLLVAITGFGYTDQELDYREEKGITEEIKITDFIT